MEHTEEKSSGMSSKGSPFRRPKGKGGTTLAVGIDEGAFEIGKSQFGYSRNDYSANPHHNGFVEVRI